MNTSQITRAMLNRARTMILELKAENERLRAENDALKTSAERAREAREAVEHDRACVRTGFDFDAAYRAAEQKYKVDDRAWPPGEWPYDDGETK